MNTSPTFLNVDLEVESREDLHPLVEALGDDVQVLFCGEARGRHRAQLEIPGLIQDPDAAINAFCDLLESLDGGAKSLWNSALSKVFNIGYESGVLPPTYEVQVRAPTVARVAAASAAVSVTVYPCPSSESKSEE